MRQMTAAGYAFLENEEGLRLFAYDDATGKPIRVGDPVRGVLTIGWGHTGPDVYAGQSITRAEAEALFDKDTDWAEEVVEKAMIGPNGERPNDHQFNACGSLAYNIGKTAFPTSMVAKNWQKGLFAESGQSFKNWNRDQFGVNSVLVARRARETSMFFEPMPSEVPKPMPQVVAPPPSAMQSKSVIAASTSPAGAAVNAGVQLEPAKINAAVEAVNNVTTTANSVMDVLSKVGPIVIAVVVLAASVYFLLRYLDKRRSGDVIST